MLERICAAIFNISLVVVCLLLTIGLMGLCGLDIFLRIYENRYVLITAGASVCLLLLGAVLIVSARKITIRSALQDIPKLYVPINPSDLPKRVHRMIQADFSRVANISLEANPRPQDASEFGWGKIGTQLENVHFRTAAIQTFELLEKSATELSPFLRRDPSLSARRYIEWLIGEEVIRKDIGRFYIDRYEQLRFGDGEMREGEYKEFMKLFALLLKSVRAHSRPETWNTGW